MRRATIEGGVQLILEVFETTCVEWLVMRNLNRLLVGVRWVSERLGDGCLMHTVDHFRLLFHLIDSCQWNRRVDDLTEVVTLEVSLCFKLGELRVSNIHLVSEGLISLFFD